MGKKIVISVLFLILTSGIVSASSKHDSFEGNPIVKLIADGKEIKADDVPAIIYNNRTMVPIYLLRQLGFEVQWDQEHYSVHVKSPSVGDTAKNNEKQAMLEQTLGYLNDLNYSMILFFEKLKFFSELENFPDYKHQWISDFDELDKRSREVNLTVLRINESLNSEVIWNIVKQQSAGFQQVKHSKEMLSLWATNPQNTNFKRYFQQSMLNSMTMIYQNYEYTKDELHKLLLQKLNLQSS